MRRFAAIAAITACLFSCFRFSVPIIQETGNNAVYGRATLRSTRPDQAPSHPSYYYKKITPLRKNILRPLYSRDSHFNLAVSQVVFLLFQRRFTYSFFEELVSNEPLFSHLRSPPAVQLVF